MASAARTFSRAFARTTPATSSFRPVARNARFALPAQTLRASSRRGYASEAGSGKSSNALIWGIGLAAAGGVGAYFYLNGADVSTKSSGPFVPTKEDYQKVYDEIARLLAEKTDYDDGSYGPVLVRLAWHASGTYDKETGTGGSNGATMRFAPEASHGANAGLHVAREFLEPVKGTFLFCSFALRGQH